MNVNIYLTEDGQKALAQGEPLIYGWYFSVGDANNAITDRSKQILIAENIGVALPSQEAVVPRVVEQLKAQIQTIYVNANNEAAALQVTLNKLLAIEHTPSGE